MFTTWKLDARLHDHAYVVFPIEQSLNSVVFNGLLVRLSNFAALSHGLYEGYCCVEVVLMMVLWATLITSAYLILNHSAVQKIFLWVGNTDDFMDMCLKNSSSGSLLRSKLCNIILSWVLRSLRWTWGKQGLMPVARIHTLKFSLVAVGFKQIVHLLAVPQFAKIWTVLFRNVLLDHDSSLNRKKQIQQTGHLLICSHLTRFYAL